MLHKGKRHSTATDLSLQAEVSNKVNVDSNMGNISETQILTDELTNLKQAYFLFHCLFLSFKAAYELL